MDNSVNNVVYNVVNDLLDDCDIEVVEYDQELADKNRQEHSFPDPAADEGVGE